MEPLAPTLGLRPAERSTAVRQAAATRLQAFMRGRRARRLQRPVLEAIPDGVKAQDPLLHVRVVLALAGDASQRFAGRVVDIDYDPVEQERL